MNSIPEDPEYPNDWYTYDDTSTYQDIPRPPCIWGYLEDVGSENWVMFYCQNGNCKKTSNWNEYSNSCYYGL
ncbi:MAG: hypothetical protein PHZ07_01560 [Patescibacteria group bacterium]|nr:hypothetical protein [Patescibacteria group bacterium]MDD4303879.1 hypothetical protein [Patescibacteria group bacterium]MDD4695134.1 hypothetical protein [Patescibacteria group bacterium]